MNGPATLVNVKFLRIQAEGDVVVPPDQACRLMSQLPGGANYYLYSGTSPPGVYWASPKECAGFSMPWREGQLLPDEVPGRHWASPTFLMYGRYGGLTHFTIPEHAWPELRSFVNAVAKSGGWPASIPNYTPLEN
jgi:hypothetical protein